VFYGERILNISTSIVDPSFMPCLLLDTPLLVTPPLCWSVVQLFPAFTILSWSLAASSFAWRFPVKASFHQSCINIDYLRF
jgi:hypothetical protein